jgi:hypothetical protein
VSAPDPDPTTVGILVFGDNHFILSGPLPDETTARAMVLHWSIIQIGAPASLKFKKWKIRTKEFRENLAWAVVVASEGQTSPAVSQLLAELSARGITIHHYIKSRA